MLFDGRVMIFADGPLTAVASFRATATERASAYTPHQAHRVVERLCRDAEGGDRYVLIDMCQLLFDQRHFHLCDVSTSVFAGRVREAVRCGRLLLVPGWPRMPGSPSAPLSEDSRSPESRIVQRIMKGEGHLSFEGERYAIVPAQDWGELRRAGTYEVLSRQQASGLLKRLAIHPAFSDRKMALDDAGMQLAPSRVPLGRAGVLVVRHVEALPVSAPPPAAPSPSPSVPLPPGRSSPPVKEAPPTRARKVLSIAWNQAEAWCSENAAYGGTTDGYTSGDDVEVALQEQGGGPHKTSLRLSSSNFSGQWQVKDVLPPKAGGHFARGLKLDAEAAGQRAPKPLLVKFAPTAKKISHTHERHTFQLSVLDYSVEVDSEIKFVPGWGASVVKLGSKVPPATGGLLDGQLAWTGYRWMKRAGVKSKFWDGEAWQDLPKDFTLIDANNFCVGFYRSGGAFVCQYGGTWPETFTAWDVDASDKAKTIKTWTDNIRTTWTGKFDLKRADCKSAKKDCCRYRVKVAATFTKQSTFSAGVIILADGNIRSNDSLFFLGEPRVAMAAHEFGHHIGNPDEYGGAKVDTSLNSDGAKNGIDPDSIMGQNLMKVKARHLRLLAKVLADAIHAEYGKTFTFDAVAP